MKYRLLFAGLISFLLLTSGPALAADAGAAREKVIIGFEEEVNPSLVQTHGGDVTDQFDFIDAVAAEVPEEAIDGLQNNPNVRYVESDRKVEALGQTLPWGVDRVDADVVHSYPNKGSNETDIAIIDTGVDHDHPDLDDNYAGGHDFVNDDSDPMDDNGHGTHVSGIAAAEDNSIGVVGAAPAADLYGAKVLDSGGSGYVSDVVAGIEWAVKGPDGEEGTGDDSEVISMSLGSDEGSTSLKDAVDYAYGNGSLPVAAAGNDGNPPGKGDNVDYPARYDSVIAVAATDKDDSRPRWSSTGPDVELSAPGVDIPSTYWDDTYETLSGTSMAAPHVSGTGALVFNSPVTDGYDADGDGSWDPDEVRQKMDDTATDLGPSGRDDKYGYGLVQADAATDEPKGHDLAVTAVDAPDWVVQGDNATINVTVENQGSFDENSTLTLVDEKDSEEIGNASVDLAAGNSKIYTFDWNTSGEATGNHTLNATVQPVANETETSDNSRTATVEVSESADASPAIDRFDVTEVNSPNPHAEFEVDWAVSDEGGDLDTVEITMTDSSGNLVDSVTVDVSGSTASGVSELKDKHAEGSGETYEFELTATDTAGHTTSATKTVTEN